MDVCVEGLGHKGPECYRWGNIFMCVCVNVNGYVLACAGQTKAQQQRNLLEQGGLCL